jgi:predicted phage tail protein
MYKVKFSKLIRKYVNNLEEVEIDGDSYFNIYTNLTNTFPALRLITSQLAQNDSVDIWFLVNGKILTHEELFLQPRKDTPIIIVPVISGAGDDIGTIFIGVAIIAISVVLMQPEFAIGAGIALSGGSGLTAALGTAALITSAAQWALGMGVMLVLSGVMGMISSGKGAKDDRPTHDSSIRANNDMFGSLQNTTNANMPVPLVFGLHRVPGQFVGGRIKTINHDAGTVISVANYL